MLVFETHGYRLNDLPKDHYNFFVVRDPLTRYVSGFYSRYRKGMPRIYNPWKNGEEEAFTNFPTPNALGEALSSNDIEKRKLAKKALASIGHVNTSYYDWFHSPEILKRNIDRIKFVAIQENLNEDFDNMKTFFGLPDRIHLPKDKTKSHKNPDSFDKKLSEKAVINLKQHYKKEYEFLDILFDEGLITEKYS